MSNLEWVKNSAIKDSMVMLKVYQSFSVKDHTFKMKMT